VTDRESGAVWADLVVLRDWSAFDGVDDPCSIAAGYPLSLVEMRILRSAESLRRRLRVTLQLTEPSCIFAFHIAAQG
jgi:hypothetical protein